jgi:hypothetical protein
MLCLSCNLFHLSITKQYFVHTTESLCQWRGRWFISLSFFFCNQDIAIGSFSFL